jgi:hypothetical protein
MTAPICAAAVVAVIPAGSSQAGPGSAWWLAERSRGKGHAQGERDALARFRLEREADEHSNRRNYYLDFLSTAEAFNRLITSNAVTSSSQDRAQSLDSDDATWNMIASGGAARASGKSSITLPTCGSAFARSYAS